MSDTVRSQRGWLKWTWRITGACLILGPIVFWVLRGKTLWPVLQAFFKAGMKFNKDVTAPQFSLAAGAAVGALVLMGIGVWLLRRPGRKLADEKKTSGQPAAETPAPASVSRRTRAARQVSYSSCVVYHAGADARRVWQFDAGHGNFALSREETVAADQSLPSAVVAKTWRSLWQRKLNIAWLPPESAFLRVVHLPRSDFDETLSMVELQLERLSPIPVTQVVWSIQTLPEDTGDLQTVIVVFAERKAVEEFLGQLEGQGYLADRLEIPALDQLFAVKPAGDGAWIFPEAVGGHRSALVAWWYGGRLQNLSLVSLRAADDGAAAVRQQLTQIAWAGELEGWLTAPPSWNLVADETRAAEWEPLLRQGLDESVRVAPPPKPAELAALTARRATTDGKSNLLPDEFATRYQQRFVDQLWMRGLAAVVGLYLIAVLIYVLALGVLYFQTQAVENKVAAASGSYTNAIQLKARHQVLRDRQDLKYAALDSWRAVADTLPDSMTLDALTFSDGHKLTLNGSAPAGEGKTVVDFFNQLRKAGTGDQSLFDTSRGDSAPRSSSAPGGGITWSFGLELKRVEAK